MLLGAGVPLRYTNLKILQLHIVKKHRYFVILLVKSSVFPAQPFPKFYLFSLKRFYHIVECQIAPLLQKWGKPPAPMDQISTKTPNPKCRLFLKLTSKGTWGQVFICLRPPFPSPPCYTLYEYMYPCTYSHREGGGGVVDEPVRRLEGR